MMIGSWKHHFPLKKWPLFRDKLFNLGGSSGVLVRESFQTAGKNPDVTPATVDTTFDLVSSGGNNDRP